MKLLIFTICIFLANCTLAKESRVFCRYNYNGVSKVYDLAYFDNEGHIEYAKVLGPTWYGVSWCDNSTMVNGIGMDYDISSIQNKLRKREDLKILMIIRIVMKIRIIMKIGIIMVLLVKILLLIIHI